MVKSGVRLMMNIMEIYYGDRSFRERFFVLMELFWRGHNVAKKTFDLTVDKWSVIK